MKTPNPRTKRIVPNSMVEIKMVAVSSCSGRGGVIPNVMMKLLVTCLSGFTVNASTSCVFHAVSIYDHFLLKLDHSCYKAHTVERSANRSARQRICTRPQYLK
jgi:hypothetical protein